VKRKTEQTIQHPPADVKKNNTTARQFIQITSNAFK